jgi:hypothetical protein
MSNTHGLTFCAVLACLALPAAMFGDVLYTDTTFATASYPVAFTYVNNITGTTTVATPPQQDVDGGPGGTTNALETIFDVAGSGNLDTTLDLGVINAAFTYNPGTQGALWDITASIGADENNSNAGYPPDPYFYLLMEQGASYYYAFVAADSAAGYQLLDTSTPLAASNFWLFNPSTGVTTTSSHPDFSSGGGTMEFGLFMISGALFAPSNNQAIFYADLSLDLASVPEPATFALAGAGLLVAGLWRKLKR